MTTLRSYAPRIALALGGVLAAVATVLPWVRFPFIGAITLWGFRGMLGDIASMTGESAGLAPTGLLLTALGALVLGLGSVVYAAVATSTRILRRGILLGGGLTTVLGVAALVQAILMTSDAGSISAGPIVLLVGGLVSLGGYVLVTSGTREHHLPTLPQHASTGAVTAGFAAAVIGLVFLFYADATVNDDEPQANDTQQSETYDQNEPEAVPDEDDLDEDWDPDEYLDEDESDIPDEDDPETSAEAIVIDEFYLFVDGGDWQEAWDKGGKHLSPSLAEFKDGYAGDMMHSFSAENVSDDGIVSGILVATDNDLDEHEYTAWYEVDTDNETIVDGGAEPVQ